MPLLALQEVTKSYGPERRLLEGANFSLSEGERVGLVGANGSGKSTLLRILVGELAPEEGQRIAMRDLHLGWLKQEPDLPADLSIREALRSTLADRAAIEAELEELHARVAVAGGDELEMLLARQARLDVQLERAGGAQIEHRIERQLTSLGVHQLDARCGDLSGGERRRVALAQLLLHEPDVLLLDEPTNHLDVHAIEWLEDRLLQLRAPVLLVTHDRYFLDRVVDRIVELEGGVLHEYPGNYAAFLVARAERIESAAKHERDRLRLLRRETEWMRRGPPARSTKAKARVQRYHDLLDRAPAPVGEFKMRLPDGPRLGDRVIEVENLGMQFGDRPLFSGIDFKLERTDRLGIVGPNGAGKSTFLELCLGAMEATTGSVSIGTTVKFARVRQDRSELNPEETVIEAVAGHAEHVRVGDRPRHVEGFLDQFLFAGDRKRTKIGSLSGGERNRVLLAGLLCAGGNVLVLDEPTNDLDLMSLRVLEEALESFPGAALIVSHDRYFLDRVANRVLVMDGEGGHQFHTGALSLWMETQRDVKKAASAAKAGISGRKTAAGKSAKAQPYRVRQRRERLSFKEKNELEALPAEIEALESELTALDERLGDPALYADGAGAAEVARERGAKAEQLEERFARWEELETKRAASE